MKLYTVITTVALVASASAHLTYTGRDFGTLSPGNQTTSITKVGSISSTFGWAYSTDADYGDSHRNRAFMFTLSNSGQVTISVQRTGIGNALLPAFSLFSGLAHISSLDAGRDHDDSPITQKYLAGLFGAPGIAQGAFSALGDWKIGAEASVPDGLGNYDYNELSNFTYIGNAADGTSANYGNASGIQGDGNADGFLTASFSLPAGTYTMMVGGAELYSGSLPAGPYTSYGTDVTVSVVPETSTAMLATLTVASVVFRRRRGSSL